MAEKKDVRAEVQNSSRLNISIYLNQVQKQTPVNKTRKCSVLPTLAISHKVKSEDVARSSPPVSLKQK